MDYSDLNLTPQLTSVDSLSNSPKAVTAFDFDSLNERNTIIPTQIQKFPWNNVPDAATIIVDWNYSLVQNVILGGNRTIQWFRPADRQILTFGISQDGTGTRTVTWPATVKWPGGVTPTLTTTANRTDFFSLIRNATTDVEFGYTAGLNYAAVPGCFLAGTSISVPGGCVPIETIKVGDYVLSLDGKKVKVLNITKQQTESYYRLKTNMGETKVTGEHPYMMADGTFKPVKDLKKGDILKTPEGRTIFMSITKGMQHHKKTIFNLTVEEPNIFIANNIYVHNKSSPSR